MNDGLCLNSRLNLNFQVRSKLSGDEKTIIRGYKSCKWHKDILKQTQKEVGLSYSLKCLGGGRIKHNPENKKLFVYGYSQVSIN